jgi:hypothetical protein
MLLVDTSRQPVTKRLSDAAGLVIAGAGVGSNDNRTQIAKVQFLQDGKCVIGLVAPFSGTQAGEEAFCQCHEIITVDFWHALLFVQRVLTLNGLANSGNAAAQHLLGDRTLLGSEGFQHGVAMRTPGTKTLRLGSRELSPRGAVATWPAVVAATAIPSAFATAAFATAALTAAALTARAVLPIAATTTIAAISTVTSVAAVAV